MFLSGSQILTWNVISILKRWIYKSSQTQIDLWPFVTLMNDKDIANRKHTYLSCGNINCTSRALSSAEDINPLCDVYHRRKVEWIDHALSAVTCNSVPALTLLSGSTQPENFELRRKEPREQVQSEVWIPD